MSQVNELFGRYLASARRIAGIQSMLYVTDWDAGTAMPKGGGAFRAEARAELAALAHRAATDPAHAGLLWALEMRVCELDERRARIVRRDAQVLARVQAIPEDLCRALASATALGERAWEEAKECSDLDAFLPHLERIVALKREEAACHAPKGSLYDALLEDNEPGLTCEKAERVFAELEAFLPDFIQRLVEKGPVPGVEPVFPAPIAAQRATSVAIARVLGFSFETGSIVERTHPMVHRVHPGDVRLATKYLANDALNSLYSTVHEVGHALYEQHLPGEDFGTSGGWAASAGLHESQSRFMENVIGRSRAFWEWCTPLLVAHGVIRGPNDPAAYHRAANIVEPSLIRTDADEVTYNLHVALRFRIERALIEGSLAVRDLREAWASAIRLSFGLEVPDDAHGALQDTHWSGGWFGNFPCYTVGNLYAAQLAVAMRKDVDIDFHVARGEFSPVVAWLHDNVHRHANVRSSDDIVERATGSGLCAGPFIAYIDAKYSDLYGL